MNRVMGYAKLVARLRKLTEKSVPYVFEGAAIKAYEDLMYSLSHAPVLASPDPDLRLKLCWMPVILAVVLCCCRIRGQWLFTATSLPLLREAAAVVSRSCWL